MTTDDPSDSDDLIAHVVHVFERMEIPPVPSVDVALVEPRNERQPRYAWAELSTRQRVVLAGIGASTLAGLMLLLVTVSSGRKLSAMERMAHQLREVKSYSYKLSSRTTTTQAGGKRSTTWQGDGPTYWRAPDAFRDEFKVVKFEQPVADGAPLEEVLTDFVQIFPAGKQGIFIDRAKKTYFKCDFKPTGSNTYPLQPLMMIREGTGEVTRELGTKEIGDKRVRGYETRFASGDERREHLWQVWIDPATDLPVEIGFDVDDEMESRTTTVLRLSDFHWNEKLDPKLFEPNPPEGYREVDAPSVNEGAPSDLPGE